MELPVRIAQGHIQPVVVEELSRERGPLAAFQGLDVRLPTSNDGHLFHEEGASQCRESPS